jgi:DnaJ-domain-containing protein 1
MPDELDPVLLAAAIFQWAEQIRHAEDRAALRVIANDMELNARALALPHMTDAPELPLKSLWDLYE